MSITKRIGYSGILISALAFWVEAGAAEPTGCSELFSNRGEVAISAPKYEQDFGSGVFVSKLSATEYSVEPPPFTTGSVREAHQRIAKLARENDRGTFTVTFDRMSEGEVLGFKHMIELEARIDADPQLSSILLPVRTEPGESDSASYEAARQRALTARASLLRRYDWSTATVRRVEPATESRRDSYVLTLETTAGGEEFLLSLRLKTAAKSLTNRTETIRQLLLAPILKSTTPEQLARSLIRDLKIFDRGITDVTLKVMAADVLIARAYSGKLCMG